MRSIPEEGRKIVSAAVLRRMGRAVNSQQDETGETFSVSSMLTNWSKLSPEAKSALFNGYSKSFRMDMDKVARVLGNLRTGASVYANPPGTARALAQVGGWSSLGTGAATSVMTGNPVPVIATASVFAGAHGGAKMMTSPRFVRWLAKNTTTPVGALAAQIPELRQIAEQEDDPEMAALADELALQVE